MQASFESIKALCPIYAGLQSERRRPELIGSGTLLDFRKARFLVTAAHVHDLTKDCRSLLYTIGPNHLLPLPNNFAKTCLPTSGKREDDHFDFAFVRFDDTQADQIAQRYYFLPFPLIDVDDRQAPDSAYMFAGYPCNRDETNHGQKRLKPKMWSRTDVAVGTTRMAELKLHPDTHIAVRFKPDADKDENHKARHFPRAKGMSGGPVWRGDGDPAKWLKTNPVRLVGIGIEDRVKDEVMVAVRIHWVTASIAEFNPDIRALVPKRVSFNY